MPTFFIPGNYVNPLTAEGRARTIAAFYVAQGNPSALSSIEMRRDILRDLMSPKAVSYWKDKGWLEVTRTIGRVQLVKLTDAGLSTCNTSASGGSDTPTYPELVETRRESMRVGGSGYKEKSFPELPAEA